MSRIAFLFPGQGSQFVGMGRGFFEETTAGRELFRRADEVVGFPLSQLCFEGPRTLLTRTENAQPAIFTVSMIAAQLLEERGVRPAAAAGHSLGEYSALVAAGAMSFEDGLRTVRRRGELMAKVADRVAGGMAAIVGLAPARVAAICRQAADVGWAEVANENSPDQTVVAGELAALERVMARALAAGAERAVPLKVAAPFHTRLMAPVTDEMARLLAEVAIRPPEFPVVANVTAEYVQTPEQIRDALTRQVAGAVRWADSIRRLAADGITTTVEVGPGSVLTGLMPRILPGLQALDTEEALDSNGEAPDVGSGWHR